MVRVALVRDGVVIGDDSTSDIISAKLAVNQVVRLQSGHKRAVIIVNLLLKLL